MVDTYKFLCFNFYIIETYSINISATIAFYICSDNIECLLCICYRNVRKDGIMDISLSYSKSDGIATR